MHNWSTRLTFLYEDSTLTVSAAVLIPQVTARDGASPDSNDHTVRLLERDGMSRLRRLDDLPSALMKPMRRWRVELGPTRGRITTAAGVLLTDGLMVESDWAAPIRHLHDRLAILYTTDLAPARMGAVDPGGNTAHLLEEAIKQRTLLVGVAPVTWSAGDP